MIFRPACVSDEASPPPGRRELVRSVSALSISFLKINKNQFLGFSHVVFGAKKSSHENYSFRAVGSFSRLDRKSLMITGRGMRWWELWLNAVKCYVMHANKNKYYHPEHGG